MCVGAWCLAVNKRSPHRRRPDPLALPCPPGPSLSSWSLVVTQIVSTMDGRGGHKMPSTMFEIPVLPRGRHLLINILSTWGDPYYVGLMGLEIFDGSGHPVNIADPDRQIWADPPDINVLAEYNNDPRTVDKLVDTHNFTCDDLHAWLAPFKRGAGALCLSDAVRWRLCGRCGDMYCLAVTTHAPPPPSTHPSPPPLSLLPLQATTTC